ncbi:hypothetical protein Q7W11_06990 [Streptococcus suis]|nr:hypothetical protein [Streptococcus suis]
MKEKICKKLKELSTKPVRRVDWSGERWFVRRYKQVLALGWIIYFLLREELVKEILRPVSSYLMNFSCIQWFYVNRLTVLLVFTALLFLAKSIFSILRWCEVIRYFPLGKKKYPEYDFPFQEELVSFLNRKEERGRNIFWLDGSWGSGKTHFIRTFFENQLYKPREIYYISCFGIRTREQAEKALIEEIEQHSTFGSLDHIPVVSSLVKWSYKILGLDLMKKYSLIIFDDLERVAYSEKQKDKPEDFNDLLGFIDYLANHRNQKVLVLMNKEDMENTYHQIVEEKFKPTVTNIPDQDKIIELVVESYCEGSFEREFLAEIFKFISSWSPVNLREIPREARSFNKLDKSEENLIKMLNDVDRLKIRLKYSSDSQEIFFRDSVSPFLAVTLFFEEIQGDALYFYEDGFIPKLNIEKATEHFKNIFKILWKYNFKNIIWKKKGTVSALGTVFNDGYYSSLKTDSVELANLFVEIYYDLESEVVKPNYLSKVDVDMWDTDKRSMLLENFKPNIKINEKEIGWIFGWADIDNLPAEIKIQYLEDWEAYFASRTNEGDTP